MGRTGRLWAALVTILVLAVVIAGAPPRAAYGQSKPAPSQADIDQAKRHMAAGVAFMQDPEGPKYEEAYREFEKAHKLSGSLNALLNLGICAMKLERDGEAIDTFERFLKDKGKDVDAEERAQVERDLQALKTAVAWVWLSADRADVIVSDTRTPSRGEPIRNVYKVGTSKLKLGIHPGSHVFTAALAGFPEQSWKVEITNGSEHDHQYRFEGTDKKPEEPTPRPTAAGEGDTHRPIPFYVWLSGGITLAAAVPMTIFMVSAAGKKSEYDDEIRGKRPLAEQEQAIDDIQTANLLGDIFLGVTAAGAVTTLILFLTRPEVKKEQAAAGAPAWQVRPWVAPHAGGALLGGSF
jgi:hypothetical protein